MSIRRYRIRYWLEATGSRARRVSTSSVRQSFLRALEEADGLRQETPALVGQQRRSPRAADLPVQLDPEPLLERQEPVSQALLRDPQHRRRGANLPLPRQLDERADLIRAECGNVAHFRFRAFRSADLQVGHTMPATQKFRRSNQQLTIICVACSAGYAGCIRRDLTMTRRFGSLVILVSAIAAITAHASFPLGVYAVIDKVVLEPGDAEPQRVQVWGAFALWDDRPGLGYRAPERGYLYYSCSKAQAGICRNEWADLKSVAGTGQTVGFGSRSLSAGRVRASGEAALAPEPYPIQFGVVQMGASPRGAIFDQLKAVARGR